MTNAQLYFALAVPALFNGAVVAILSFWLSAKFEDINHRFAALDKRFDDMKDMWRAELHRVEEVIDARLKHLEEGRKA